MNRLYFDNVIQIGKLYLEHIFYEFESEPVLFTCSDEQKNLYFCLCSDIRYGQRWIIMPCSLMQLEALIEEKADIADGVCHAIANKAFGLLRRVGMEPDFMMTGGVAKNPGVVRAVEEKIGSSLYICEEPEIVGAAGAALYALEKVL